MTTIAEATFQMCKTENEAECTVGELMSEWKRSQYVAYAHLFRELQQRRLEIFVVSATACFNHR